MNRNGKVYSGEFNNTAMFIVNQGFEMSVVKVGEYEADLYISDSEDETNAIAWIDGKRKMFLYIRAFYK